LTDGDKCCIEFSLKNSSEIILLPAMFQGLLTQQPWLGEKQARVLVLTPVSEKLKPCDKYLANISHDDKQCPFSHGYASMLSKVRPYEDIEKGTLLVGSTVLAKYSDELWYKARIVEKQLNGSQPRIQVIFDGYEDECVVLGPEEVIPLVHSDESKHHALLPHPVHVSDDEELEDEVASVTASAQSSSSKDFGEWERHTRSIGSKLLMKMGYIKVPLTVTRLGKCLIRKIS
jgi:hypothetical protein